MTITKPPVHLYLILPLILGAGEGSAFAAESATTPQASATVMVSTAANPSVLGQPVVITATVTPSAGSTGLVTFYDGQTPLGTRSLTAGTASLSTVLLPTGVRSLHAYYAGSGSLAASTSAAFTQVVTTVAEARFANPVNYSAGSQTRIIAAGDFNADGKADLVVTNQGNSFVNVFLGNADGTFHTPGVFNAGISAFAVVVGDFNQDGKQDLAVANDNFSGTVSVLLGNGDGTFQQPVPYATAKYSTSLAIGDFNGDGKPDLAVTNIGSNNMSILLGNGDGTFQPAVTYLTSNQPEFLAVGDFNGDGIADIVVASEQGNTLNVYLGNGDGTFPAPLDFTPGINPSSLAVGDLNGDGKLDIVASNFGSFDVSVLLGNGDGTFQNTVSYPAGVSPGSVVIVDINGDGKPDLAVANYGGTNSVGILLGNGDGTFRGFTSFPAGTNPISLVAGDFNGDGKVDLATANYDGGNVSVLLGMGTPAASSVLLLSSPNPSNLGQLVTFTATVSPNTATGPLMFKDGNTTLGTGTLSNGTATLSVMTLAGGFHTVTAIYGGDIGYTASTSNTVNQTVGQSTASTTTLLSSPNPSTPGQNVTMVAVVSPATSSSTATPTGTVTFVDGTSALATVALNNGAAILTLSTLTVGPHSLTAAYSGDINYASTTSTSLTQQVMSPVCGYSLTPSSASVIAATSTGSFMVNAPAGCTFTATVTSGSTGIVTITNVNGNTVNYSLPANTTPGVRTATIAVAGQNNFSQKFEIVQAITSTSCNYQLVQLGQSFTSGGGSGSIGIITPVGCPWSLNSSSVPSWVTVSPPFSGFGKAALNYTVANSSSAPTRVANLTFSGTSQSQVAVSYGVTETGTLVTESCTVSGPSPVTQVALEGRTEVLGSLTLNCTGLTGSITTDILLTLNTPVTNQVNSTTNLSDATLTNGTAAQGAQVIGYSTLRWPAVLLKPVGGVASVTITNVRADASTLAPPGGPAPQATVPITGRVSLNSAGTVPLPNPNATLANAVTTLMFQSGSPAPMNGTQAILAVSFQESSAAPTAFSPGATATRLRAVVSSVPAGVQVWVPVGASAGTATAQLYTADCSGAGGSPATGTALAGGTYSQLTVTGGIATATWVVTSAMNSVDTLAFPLLLVNPGGAGLSGIQVTGSLAPVSPPGTACSSGVSATAIPRYRDFSVPLTQTFLRLTTSGTASRSSGTVSFLDNVMNEGTTTVTNATANGIVQSGTNPISCTATGGVGGSCVGYGNASAPQLQPGQYACSWTSLPTGLAACTGSAVEDPGAFSQPATLTAAGVSADGLPADIAPTESAALISQNFGPNVQVESPASGAVSGTVNVSGWSVDAAVAVSSVQLQVDGITKGTVSTSSSRPDVCNLYSNYFGCMNAAGPNVGFTIALDTAILSTGSHALTVLATAADGLSTLSSPPITITNGVALKSIAVTPANPSIPAGGKQQFTATATYSDNSTQNLTNSVVWASATSSVATIVAGGLSTGVSAGTSIISASSGSVSGSTVLTVTPAGAVLPTVAIDQPASGSNVSGVVTVAGWALDNATSVGAAISSIQVKVDGVAVGTATYGTPRPDVCITYPGRPNCPNVGYTFSFNTATVTAGSHTLMVCATDSDSTPDTGCNSVTITTAVPSTPPSVVIDSPANNAALSGMVVVSGWALDNTTALGSAISSVQVKVDGAVVGTASYGTSRPDVCTAYTGRAGCPNVGYTFMLNTAGLSVGTHTLTVSATDSDTTPDTGTSRGVTFTVTGSGGAPPSLAIDSPLPNASVSGTVTVSGWAIDNTAASGTAISIVQVNVDGAFVGTTTYGLPRPDVCVAFPARPGCPNVGYTFSLNTSGLSAGSHTITVLATDSDGSPDIGSKSVTVTVMGAPPLVYIENPTSGMTLNGTVNVSGWAIDNATSAGGTAIASVQLKVDGTVVGNASYGTPRPDVCAAFPNRPSCPNVGWTFALNTSTLASGAHTLTAVATDTDGTPDSGSWAIAFTVSPQPLVAIDSPAAGSALSGTVAVTGWAIDFAGGNAIASVTVKVDGNLIGNATYGVGRPDVCTAYPNRTGCPNVGYSFALNTSILSAGTHTLTVQAADSFTTPYIGSKTITFTTSAVPPLVRIDNPSPGTTVSGTLTVSGWAIDNGNAVGTAIGSVQVMVDGSVVGNATYGLARPDVCAAYPSRPGCPNVGYTISLNTSTLAPGSHVITVTATDTDGSPDIGASSVTVVK